jgi:hypothetical protein
VKKFRLPESLCPYCGTSITASTAVTGQDDPTNGDVMVCLYCSGVCVFGADGRLARATEEQLAEFMADPVVVRAVWAVRRARLGR